MRVEGWLLDVCLAGDHVVLWVRDPDRGRVKLLDRYAPDFYAEPRGIEAEQLQHLLEEHEQIDRVTVERRVSSIRSLREATVLRVHVDRVESYRGVLSQVESLPWVGDVFDADLPHALKYICDRGLVPMGKLAAEADGDGLVGFLSPVETGLEVEPPPLHVLCFRMDMDGGRIVVTTLDGLMRPEYVFSGPARQVLRDFLDYFADLDPDIVCCSDGDLAAVLRLGKLYRMRRFGIVHGGRPTLWGGRVHVRPSIYGRLGLAGLVERVQFTRVPPRMSAGWAPGKAIDSRQCYEARRRGVLVPRAGFFQPVMPLDELLLRDQGGLILAPDVGLHENVAVLDFESMFPNLILRRNISYETVGRRRCGEGFIAGFTRDALTRRLHFKHLRRRVAKGSPTWVWCEERQLALKEMLVVIYGYSGCFANRFGNVATYMEINRAARDCLVEAMNVAREAGFRTLYGNNDSLFIKRPGATPRDHEALAAEISRRVGLQMAVENVFRFLVLLPQKAEPAVGAVNRYYGRTVEGGHEFRGIELRRRDTPPYVARVQREAIEALLGCESVEEVRTVGVRRALEVVEDACRRLRRGEVPPEELRFSTMLRRSPDDYRSHLPHVAAAKALNMNGVEVEAGSLIDYLYVDAGHQNPFRRVKPAGFAGGRIDTEKYVELVREAVESLIGVLNQRGATKISGLRRCLLDSCLGEEALTGKLYRRSV